MTSNFQHIIPTEFYKLNRFLFILFASAIFFIGCKGDEEQKTEEIQASSKYSDGSYCATVTYYNPNLKRQSEYTLNVEVENGDLTKIFWLNGGYLDDSHFTPPEVPSNGECSFTSYKGYQYTVSINGLPCTQTDNPEAIEGSEGSILRSDCAKSYGASDELFKAYLKERNVLADDMIDNHQCDLMHKSLETLSRLRNIEQKIDKGYIQLVYSKSREDRIYCQVMIIKRKGVFYLLEVSEGKATMGLTSFNPSDEGWQEILIQEKPSEEQWSGVTVRVVTSGSMEYLDNLARNYCN